MASNDKPSNSAPKNGAPSKGDTDKSDDAVVKNATLEEVDAEIVETHADLPNPDAVHSDGDTSVQPVDAAARDAKAASKAVSAGVIFLSVLALLGVVATSLWAVRNGKTSPQSAPIEKASTENEALGVNPANDAVQPITPTAQINGRDKIANDIEPMAKVTAAQIDTQAVDAGEKAKLPAPPIATADGANNSIQQAAKKAAAEFAQEAQDKAPVIIQNEAEPIIELGLSDPVADAADLFAADPQQAETPEDQLGVDPVAAVAALQKAAAANDEREDSVQVDDMAHGSVDALLPNDLTTDNVVAPKDAPVRVDEGNPAENAARDQNAAIEPTENLQDDLPLGTEYADDETAKVLDTPVAQAVAAQTATPDADAAAREVAEKFAALEDSFEQRTARIAEALERERERAALQSEEISTLKREYDEALAVNAERSSNEIATLRSRIDELQAREADKRNATDQQTRALLAIISVQRQFDQGAPYQRELAVLKKAMPGAVDFAPLDLVAQNGAPTIASLKEQFPEAIRSTLASSNTSAKGPVGHIMRNLQSLVSVRPAAPRDGDSAPAIISRAEGYLGRDDLARAISELDALGSAVSPAMETWLERAKQREGASALVNQLNDQLLAGVSN